MANLAMAIPSMQSGEPQGSADDAIVTEKSFVQFANSFDKLSAKIVVNKKKAQRVHERIDLMMERRARRLGQPERARAEEDEDQEATGGVIKNVISVFGTIIKGVLGFLSVLGKWLMKNLLRFGGIGLAAKAAIGLLFGKVGLIAGAAALTAIGLGVLAKEVINIFSSSGDSEKSEEPPDPPDFVGDGDDTEAPTPAPVVTPTPAPVVDPVPIPKTKPPVPQRPPAETPARPKADAPKRPAAAKPVGVPAKVSAPAKPQRVPEKVAKKQPGTPVKKLEDDFDREFEKQNAKEDAEFAKTEARIKAKNEIDEVLAPKLDELLEKRRTQTTGVFDPRYEEITKDINKIRQQIQDRRDIIFGKEESAAPAGAPEKIEDDFKVDIQPGAQVERTETETSQETATETTTTNVTETGGGSTERTSAVTVLSPEAEKLKAEHDKIEKEMMALGRRLISEGMSPGDAMNDPRVSALAKRKREIGIKIDTIPRIEVSAGSVTRTPGKNIRKTSTKVIVKPVIVTKETRVR